MSVWGQLILSDYCTVSGGSSAGTGFGATSGVNTEISARLSGIASSGLSYLQTATGKSSSSYSIVSNKISVAVAANPGRFTFTADRTTPKDFGPVLGTTGANATDPVVYEFAAKISNRSSGIERTSFGVSTSDTGVQDWQLGVQLVNNGANLDLYRRVDATANPSGADYSNVIATFNGRAGDEIDLRLRITDAGAESGTNFNSKYEVFADGNLVFASAPGDFRFANSTNRIVLFDTAPNAGPVTYDDFTLTSLNITNPPVATNPPLAIVSYRLVPAGFEFAWTSHLGTNYTVLQSTNLAPSGWRLATNLTAAGTNTAISVGIDQRVATYYRVAQLAQSGLSLANISAVQRPASSLVDIYYDLADVYSGNASVSVLVSTDGGLTYRAAAASFTGDVGSNVAPGTQRHIVWNVGADWPSISASNIRIKIVADRSLVATNMALIPGGSFNMGDAQADGLSSETPVHSVNVGSFYMARHEVTKALWDDVKQWATNHGYSFESSGVANNPNHPVQQVSWYDAVKWCNARSEKEGLPPAYFADAVWTTVYRSGELNLAETNVRWQGAGYRLPTEAEWEKAARGNFDGKRFPFGDTINQSEANYWSTTFETFDVAGTAGPHPLASEFPNVLPVGTFRPSGYGLYDMAGNIWEWCWDYYGDTWYSDARASTDNTHGPSSASWGGDRVYRGGSGVDIAWKSRVANRADAPPRFAMGHFGFRVVLPAGENLVSGESTVFTLIQ